MNSPDYPKVFGPNPLFELHTIYNANNMMGFDISVPLVGAPAELITNSGMLQIPDFPGYAELARVVVPVEHVPPDEEIQAGFHVFGATRELNLKESFPSINEDGLSVLPAGSIAVISTVGLATLAERMSKSDVAHGELHGGTTPTVRAEHAIPIPGSSSQIVTVGRGEGLLYAELLKGESNILASRVHFTAAALIGINGIRAILRIYGKNNTQVTYMRPVATV